LCKTQVPAENPENGQSPYTFPALKQRLTPVQLHEQITTPAMSGEEAAPQEEEYIDYGAEVPSELKNLRACLRCALIKTNGQFVEGGCENCDFLNMKDDDDRVASCTTMYFEGNVALMEAQSSWVAKWQRIVTFVPGIYALEVTGRLPDDAIEACENGGYEIRSDVNR
jgi:transcription elongation factor SPT4